MTILLLLANFGLLLYRATLGPLRELDLLMHGAFGLITLFAFGIRLFRERRGLRRHRAYDRLVRNAMKHGDYSSILGVRRCRVTKEFVENVAALWESRWQLRCVQRIEVTPHVAFVYITPNQAIIFPIRAFVSQDHFATFIANLEGHTGKVADRFKT